MKVYVNSYNLIEKYDNPTDDKLIQRENNILLWLCCDGPHISKGVVVRF